MLTDTKGITLYTFDKDKGKVSSCYGECAKHWPPYAVMSDYYKKKGDLKNAREVLEKGLLASPDAKALKERLATLDAVKK